MANQATSVLFDSQVVDFFSQLSYLRGYKAALYDAKIRFQVADKEVVKRWNFELEAFARLTAQISALLTQNPGIGMDELQAELSEMVSVEKSDKDLPPEAFDAMRYAVERSLGIIVELRRITNSAEAQAA